MSIVDVVENMLTRAFEDPKWGNTLLAAQGLDSRRLSDAAPMDDEIPPLTPTNVMATAFLKAISVQWAPPRKDDFVVKALVELTPSDTGIAQTIDVTDGNGRVFYDLEYVDYSIRVMFVDMWGRVSLWSSSVVAKPAETAEYKFDAAKLKATGALSGFLEGVNEQLLAGENFAEATVRHIALAQPEHPNQLPMIEVDFDQWDLGMVWPPADTNTSGSKYIQTVMPEGITASIAQYGDKKWLQVVRTTATTPNPSIYPFSAFKRREIVSGTEYIASVYVQGAAGTQVNFGVQGATQPDGLSVLEIGQTGAVILDGSQQRIFFKFIAGDTYPYIRFRLDTMLENTTSRWTRFQLEQADGKTEPSGWTPGIFSTGILNARMLTAIDAVIANGLFQEAAIASAAIKDLTADKITAGILNAGTINVASLLKLHQGGGVDAQGDTLYPGRLEAGNTWLDSSGLSLLTQGSYNAPASLRSSAITGRDSLGVQSQSAIAFYDDSTNKYRGIIARADGNQTNDGLIALHVTNDGNLANNSTAKVELRAAKSGSSGSVFISRNLTVADKAYADDFVIQAGPTSGRKLSELPGPGHGHPKSDISGFGHSHDFDQLPSNVAREGGSIWAETLYIGKNKQKVNILSNGTLKVNLN